MRLRDEFEARDVFGAVFSHARDQPQPLDAAPDA